MQAKQELPTTRFAAIPLLTLCCCAILFDVAPATPRTGVLLSFHTSKRACPRLYAPLASLLKHDQLGKPIAKHSITIKLQGKHAHLLETSLILETNVPGEQSITIPIVAMIQE